MTKQTIRERGAKENKAQDIAWEETGNAGRRKLDLGSKKQEISLTQDVKSIWGW
jgi:hypothetical protein